MKIKKIIFVMLIFLMVVFSFQGMAFADDTDPIESLITSMGGENGLGDVSGIENSKIGAVINAVIKLIQIAGSGIAIIVVTMLGVKYMLASSGEKADIKKTAVPIVIGCVLLFAASNIVGIIAEAGIGIN